MKITKLSLLAAAALGSMMVAPRSEAQTLTVSEGDLLIGFYSTSGANQNTYIFNLGSASLFRENTVAFSESLGNLGSISSDLVAAFGSTWYNDSTLRWGLIGGVTNNSGLLNGDPTRTIYYSKGMNTFSPDSTANPAPSNSQLGTMALRVADVMYASNGVDSATNPNGAIVLKSEANDFSQFVPPTTGTWFGTAIDPLASFGAGTIGTSTNGGGYGVESALDMYRILNTLDNADLTAGLSQGDAALRTGQYIGTLTLDSAGNLRLDAVPEPSTYALMAIAGIALLIFRRRRTAADVQ